MKYKYAVDDGEPVGFESDWELRDDDNYTKRWIAEDAGEHYYNDGDQDGKCDVDLKLYTEGGTCLGTFTITISEWKPVFKAVEKKVTPVR